MKSIEYILPYETSCPAKLPKLALLVPGSFWFLCLFVPGPFWFLDPFGPMDTFGPWKLLVPDSWILFIFVFARWVILVPGFFWCLVPFGV